MQIFTAVLILFFQLRVFIRSTLAAKKKIYNRAVTQIRANSGKRLLQLDMMIGQLVLKQIFFFFFINYNGLFKMTFNIQPIFVLNISFLFFPSVSFFSTLLHITYYMVLQNLHLQHLPKHIGCFVFQFYRYLLQSQNNWIFFSFLQQLAPQIERSHSIRRSLNFDREQLHHPQEVSKAQHFCRFAIDLWRWE